LRSILFRGLTTSVQIRIVRGTVVAYSRDWFDPPLSSERFVVVYAEESSFGASFLYIKLGTLEDSSVIYTCLIKLLLD